ncbi:ABC-three component system middle component 5 [Elizabethkingia meningoseptica]
MLHLLSKLDNNKKVEVDRVRIWDFYLLFPGEIFTIRPKKNEVDFKKLLKNLTIKKENPYQKIVDQRKILEKIKPYQMAALSCLASYKIIDKDELFQERVQVISKELLEQYIKSLGNLSERERNIISIVTSSFYDISLFGQNGLKNRSNLIESKYDAK